MKRKGRESEGDFVRFNDKYRLRKRRGEKGERAERDRVTQLLKHDIKRGRGRIRGMRKIVNILTRGGGGVRGGGVGISLRLALFIRGKQEARSERGLDGGKAKQAVGLSEICNFVKERIGSHRIGWLIQNGK